MNPEIFITSFHELVHHMTADYGLLFVIAITSCVAISWSLYDLHRVNMIVRRQRQLLEAEGPCDESALTDLARRLVGRCMDNASDRSRTIFPLGIFGALALDYLVLVFMNSMGW